MKFLFDGDSEVSENFRKFVIRHLENAFDRASYHVSRRLDLRSGAVRKTAMAD